jgi:hypothetical protein
VAAFLTNLNHFITFKFYFMKKLLFNLSFLTLIFWASNESFAETPNISLQDSDFRCVNFTTDCGTAALACGFTVNQIAEDMVMWNNYWCNPDMP